MLIASTTYDLIMWKNDADPNKLFISFSVYTNGKQLFDLAENTSPNSINCLHGLRSMSFFWIILGHRFLTPLNVGPITNYFTKEEHYNHIYSIIVTSYNLAADTFLVMGALLVTISTLKALDKKSLNIPKIILHRYIRYTPVFAAVILYTASLHRFVLHQPRQYDRLIDRCAKYWWSALLHIQNYVNPFARCHDPTWYLSMDFHLFVISPFLIYPAWKYGWKYLWSLLVLAVMSSVYVFAVCYANEIPVNRTSSDQNNFYTKFIYQPTHARMGPWMVGKVLGYILHTTRNRNITISWKLNSILWILSLSVITAIVIGLQPLYINHTPLLANAIYIAFHRLAWSCAIFWIIFASGLMVWWFLSWPEWQPIARMSLSMYVIHHMYIVESIYNIKDGLTYEIWPMVSFQHYRWKF